MRNRLTPEKMPDVSSGPCSRFPSTFACSTVEDVTLAEVESYKQEMLTSSSYSHKNERQNTLCHRAPHCALFGPMSLCSNNMHTRRPQRYWTLYCSSMCVLVLHSRTRLDPQNAEMIFSQSDELVPGLFVLEALAWHAQERHHKD